MDTECSSRGGEYKSRNEIQNTPAIGRVEVNKLEIDPFAVTKKNTFSLQGEVRYAFPIHNGKSHTFLYHASGSEPLLGTPSGFHAKYSETYYGPNERVSVFVDSGPWCVCRTAIGLLSR